MTPCTHILRPSEVRVKRRGGQCKAPGTSGEFWVRGRLLLERRTIVLCPEHAACMRPATRPEAVNS